MGLVGAGNWMLARTTACYCRCRSTGVLHDVGHHWWGKRPGPINRWRPFFSSLPWHLIK